MVRNLDWWGTADYPHNIDRVVHVAKADPENVAALLDGEIDLLQIPPYWALDQIRSTGAEAHLSDEAAHDVLRLGSGQRRVAFVQHQGAQSIQG
jgi:ABC-type transport system substrate-binding protein